MLSAKKQILTIIERKGPGSLWSAEDFMSRFQRHEIDESLVRLKQEKVIRRVIPGIYELPKISSLLDCAVPVDIYELAKKIATKFRWQICPDGETALNYLELTTQLPGRYLYFSDGPNRTYSADGMELEFRHTTKRWLIFNEPESLLLVQGLLALGQEQFTEEHRRHLLDRYDMKTWEKIKADILAAPIWINEIIRAICEEKKEYEAHC